MTKQGRVSRPNDEIIFKARYTSGWFWFSVAFGLLFIYALIHIAYDLLIQGEYFQAACAMIGVIAFVPLTLEI
jgi:hypothetical protein